MNLSSNGKDGHFLFVGLQQRHGTIPPSKHACIFYKRLCKHNDS